MKQKTYLIFQGDLWGKSCYLLSVEPGAFIHNRIYAQRLIYDSIDWIFDNNVNDSTCADLNALSSTTYPFKDKAVAYLCSGGGRP